MPIRDSILPRGVEVLQRLKVLHLSPFDTVRLAIGALCRVSETVLTVRGWHLLRFYPILTISAVVLLFPRSLERS